MGDALDFYLRNFLKERQILWDQSIRLARSRWAALAR